MNTDFDLRFCFGYTFTRLSLRKPQTDNQGRALGTTGKQIADNYHVYYLKLNQHKELHDFQTDHQPNYFQQNLLNLKPEFSINSIKLLF